MYMAQYTKYAVDFNRHVLNQEDWNLVPIFLSSSPFSNMYSTTVCQAQ